MNILPDGLSRLKGGRAKRRGCLCWIVSFVPFLPPAWRPLPQGEVIPSGWYSPPWEGLGEVYFLPDGLSHLKGGVPAGGGGLLPGWHFLPPWGDKRGALGWGEGLLRLHSLYRIPHCYTHCLPHDREDDDDDGDDGCKDDGHPGEVDAVVEPLQVVGHDLDAEGDG